MRTAQEMWDYPRGRYPQSCLLSPISHLRRCLLPNNHSGVLPLYEDLLAPAHHCGEAHLLHLCYLLLCQSLVEHRSTCATCVMIGILFHFFTCLHPKFETLCSQLHRDSHPTLNVVLKERVGHSLLRHHQYLSLGHSWILYCL